MAKIGDRFNNQSRPRGRPKAGGDCCGSKVDAAADAQRVSIDAAVREALEARAQAAGLLPRATSAANRSPEAVTARRICVDAAEREIGAMPVLDRRSPRAIMDDLNDL
jgi:hypothetical protein